MLWNQTDRSLWALAQMAPRGQAALLSGLGHALTQATGRQPDDLCHRKGTSHLPDHGRDRRRLTKPKSFRSGVLVQNVQTPGPMLQHWECVTKDQPSPGGTADLEPGAFDWRRPQPSLRDSDACDWPPHWPPHPNTEVLGYCHASLRDIRIGCGALTFLSAAELREAFGVRGACSRTPNAS